MYGTAEGTFPSQYLVKKKIDNMLFKRDVYDKKRHNKSLKRYIMLFCFPFCFLGLVFCPMFRRKENKTMQNGNKNKT